MYINQWVECGGMLFPECLSEPDYPDDDEMALNELITLKLREILEKSKEKLTQVELEIIDSYQSAFDDSYSSKLRQMIEEEIPEACTERSRSNAYTADHREVGFDMADWVEF